MVMEMTDMLSRTVQEKTIVPKCSVLIVQLTDSTALIQQRVPMRSYDLIRPMGSGINPIS